MPPPPAPPPPLRLELTTNSLRNTTFADSKDAFYYEVRTPYWEAKHTRINRLDNDTRELRCVAEIERKEKNWTARGMKIRFLKPDQKVGDEDEKAAGWVGVGEWLKYDPKGGATFTDVDGVTYRWKTHKRQLQLIRADDEESRALVRYHAPHRHFGVFRMSKHAWLEVSQGLAKKEGNMERLIMSYILVARRQRYARIRIRLERA